MFRVTDVKLSKGSFDQLWAMYCEKFISYSVETTIIKHILEKNFLFPPIWKSQKSKVGSKVMWKLYYAKAVTSGKDALLAEAFLETKPNTS